MASDAKPLRILLFSAAPRADAGGVQNVVFKLADHLRSRGHQVVTAWPDGEGTRDDWRLQLAVDVGANGKPGFGAVMRGAANGTTLAARLGRWRPDIVNLHYPQGQTAYFELLKPVLGYGLVLSFHNSDLRCASPALRSALPRFMRGADAVTAVARNLGDLADEYGHAGQTTVIPNGVDTGFWSPGEPARDPFLAVAAGRLMEAKGFDVLLRAFAQGAPDGARLVIAGEGELRGELTDLATGLGIADRVSMPGRLGFPALRALYREAGLFVLSSRREGMPLALIEAMASGAPVVSTAIDGAPDVMVDGAGDLVPSEDVSALADALWRRLGDKAWQEKASAAARTRALEFDETTAYERYEAVFAKVVHG